MLGTVDAAWLIVVVADTMSRHEYSRNVLKLHLLLQFPFVAYRRSYKFGLAWTAVTPESRILRHGGKI